ncbi:MAG: GDSL-type esterase/lipase family protein, partial [Faecalibacterium prausnitzii]
MPSSTAARQEQCAGRGSRAGRAGRCSAQKLYILLGTNTLTTVGAADRFLAYYGQMLDVLRQTLGEDCVIYVESIPPVRPEAAAEKPGLASDIIRSVNEQLALLAADKGCVYLDLW